MALNEQIEQISSLTKKREIEGLASEVLRLARDSITVRFRFFDSALAKIKLQYAHGLNGVCMKGMNLLIDPSHLLKLYLTEPGYPVRVYLHVLMHFIFFHPFQYDKVNAKFWDLATDLAVENIILEMEFSAAGLSRDGIQRDKLLLLKKRVPTLTAEKIYKEFLVHDLSSDLEKQYREWFSIDFHQYWRSEDPDDGILTEEEFQKITRRIRTELKAFSKGRSQSEALEKNVDEALRVRYNYREILEKFMVRQEEMCVNDDEFDYIYYTYGLQLYGNLPLIEALEYKENHKIHDFVIAIDTSASCQGETVKKFIAKTYDIMKTGENFFRKINVHIIQCDSQIQMDTKITNEADFQDFMKNGKIKGFGDTDFSPVFTYVDDLKKKGEFDQLKGLIFFTDGYGVYPQKMPEYDVIFAFLNEDERRPAVPGWALKVVIEEDTL